MKESDKDVVRSIRISKSYFDEFARDAKERNVSLNASFNKLICDYVEHTLPMSQFKPLCIPSRLIKLLTDEIPQNRIIEFAEALASDAIKRSFRTEANRDSSAGTILQFMKSTAKYHSYDFTVTEHGSKKIIILVHDVGRNWSIFLANFWKTYLASAGLEVKISTDDYAAIFEFDTERAPVVLI